MTTREMFTIALMMLIGTMIGELMFYFFKRNESKKSTDMSLTFTGVRFYASNILRINTPDLADDTWRIVVDFKDDACMSLAIMGDEALANIAYEEIISLHDEYLNINGIKNVNIGVK